jgi:hypothetical protein
LALTTYSAVVFEVLQREYAPLKHAAKLLARHARTSPRTAENWLAGTHAPNGEKLINLMAECSALADEINRLIAERKALRGTDPCGHSQSNSGGAASGRRAG